MSGIDLVTGAFGYTGTYLRRRLQAQGHQVRTLTNHPPTGLAAGTDGGTGDAAGPGRPGTAPGIRSVSGSGAGGGRRGEPPVEVFRYAFDDPDALTRAFTGVRTFYNTYWVRYAPGGTSYEQAVANTEAMFAAARRAGVERIVHVSITNPDPTSFYPYYRGKARLEESLAGCGVPYAIVRPTVVFGEDDILVNNIAWLLRRFHLFAVPGDGRYRLRPVHVDDLAALCVRLGESRDQVVVDAVGPESFTFEELLGVVAAATGTRWWPVHLPPALVTVLLRGLSLLTRDVVLTRDEVDGLMAELVMSHAPTSCPTRLTDYLRAHADTVGRHYHSELARRRPVTGLPGYAGQTVHGAR